MQGRSVWREAAVAYGYVLSNPGLILRFAAPWYLLVIGMTAAVALLWPDLSTNGWWEFGLFIALLVAGAFFSVNLHRHILRGDSDLRLGLTGTDLRYTGWSFALFILLLAAFAALALPIYFTAAAFGYSDGFGELVGTYGALPLWLLWAVILGRFGGGLVSVAVGRPASLEVSRANTVSCRTWVTGIMVLALAPTMLFWIGADALGWQGAAFDVAAQLVDLVCIGVTTVALTRIYILTGQANAPEEGGEGVPVPAS